MFKIKEES